MRNKIEFIVSKRGYIVSENGICYNPKGKIIGEGLGNTGYKEFRIRIKGKSVRVFNHRLQAFQKYGSSLFKDGIEVRHLDGNKENNSWKNILIGTHSQNMMDIPYQVRLKKALHATSFIRKHDRKKIKIFHENSKSYKETMDKFGISSKGTLHFILNN